VTPLERFSRLTIPEPNSGCLLWIGSWWKGDYGRFWLNGRYVSACRFALETRLGRPLRKGMEPHHKCIMPPCVRGDHLEEQPQPWNRGRWRVRSVCGLPGHRRKVHWPSDRLLHCRDCEARRKARWRASRRRRGLKAG